MRVIGLQAAREQAFAIRQKLPAGIDPAAERKSPERVITFEEAARALIAEQRDSWSNAKHAAQWLTTLQTYAFATLGKLPVTQVTSPAVRDAVLPIWLKKPETAQRVLQRIGAVLDWATAKGIRPSGCRRLLSAVACHDRSTRCNIMRRCHMLTCRPSCGSSPKFL